MPSDDESACVHQSHDDDGRAPSPTDCVPREIEGVHVLLHSMDGTPLDEMETFCARSCALLDIAKKFQVVRTQEFRSSTCATSSCRTRSSR